MWRSWSRLLSQRKRNRVLNRARTRGTLVSRLERLEARSESLQPIRIRYGHLRQLPADYKGERHVVVTKQLPSQDGREWVEFEEVPGPAPVHECPPPDTHTVDVHFVGTRDPNRFIRLGQAKAAA